MIKKKKKFALTDLSFLSFILMFLHCFPLNSSYKMAKGH